MKALIKKYIAGSSIPLLADEFEMARSTVRAVLKSFGVLRTRNEAIALAASQGRLGSGWRGKRRVFSDETKEKLRASALARGVASAKGTRITSNGYVEFTRDKHKGRGVHVVKMEEKIGRCLFSHECVHHKNHDRKDNKLSNLVLMTKADHARLHALERHRDRNKKGQYK